MAKRRQHPRCACARRSLDRRSLLFVTTIFVTAVMLVPAAHAQASGDAVSATCNGYTKPLTASPGCTPVYFFQGGADGGDPIGGVALASNGSLYGTTNGAGVNEGTVYEMTPPVAAGGAWTYALLYSFGTIGANDGIQPQGSLVVDAKGVVYGMTPNGGSAGCGVVYDLTPPSSPGGSWTYGVLHSFLGGADGCHPWWAGVILDKNGALYGTTAYGGGAGNGGAGWGTVFELAPPAAAGGTWTETVLYSFTGGADGGYPQASLLRSSGTLYGTTQTGGITACGSLLTEGCGVVFELKPQAGGKWKHSVLYSFAGGNDGGLSSAPLISNAGVLYGTTSQENSFYQNGGDCTWGCGTVFSLAPPVAPSTTWTETVLYHFVAPYAPPYTTCPMTQCDASAPASGVVFGPHGSLYGTTVWGGPFSTGTIFELAPPVAPSTTWTESVLYDIHYVGPAYTSFPTSPYSGLTVGKQGKLYGTGSGNTGMVFQLKP